MTTEPIDPVFDAFLCDAPGSSLAKFKVVEGIIKKSPLSHLATGQNYPSQGLNKYLFALKAQLKECAATDSVALIAILNAMHDHTIAAYMDLTNVTLVSTRELLLRISRLIQCGMMDGDSQQLVRIAETLHPDRKAETSMIVNALNYFDGDHAGPGALANALRKM